MVKAPCEECRCRVTKRHRREWDDIEGDARTLRGYIENFGETPAMTASTRDRLQVERDRLRAALVGLVGVSTREELEQLEVVMRVMPSPAEDKAATIDAIHALIATLESVRQPRCVACGEVFIPVHVCPKKPAVDLGTPFCVPDR